MMGRVTNDDAKLPVTAPLTDLAADLGVATRFTAHNGEETTVSRETILKILAALDVDLGDDPRIRRTRTSSPHAMRGPMSAGANSCRRWS